MHLSTAELAIHMADNTVTETVTQAIEVHTSLGVRCWSFDTVHDAHTWLDIMRRRARLSGKTLPGYKLCKVTNVCTVEEL